MGAFSGETIWIVGASSGIGASLATRLAREGARLILSARRLELLQELADQLVGDHLIEPLDVQDAAAIEALTESLNHRGIQVNRVIFMAALYQPSGIASLKLDDVQKMLNVNLFGAIAITQAAMRLFKNVQNARGQLVLCASVAGFVGLPHGQPYSASKAALINFAQSLYAESGDTMDVKLINPGFVRTQLTEKNKFHMPFCLEPEEAARCIVKGLNQKKFEIHFPKKFTLMIKFMAQLPNCLKLPLLMRLRP